jgi:hypothetical protein
MAATTTRATPKKRAPARRKAATTRTRPTRAQSLAERAVLIPVGAAFEAGNRAVSAVEGLVTKNLGLNVENLTTQVEKVVQDGVDAGMRLVNGVQERLPKVV